MGDYLCYLSINYISTMKLKAIFLFISILSSPYIWTQNAAVVDSLYSIMPEQKDTNRLNILLELFIEHLHYDLDKSREIVEEYKDIAEGLDFTKFKATGHNISGITYNMSSLFKESIEEYKVAQDMYSSINERRYLSLVLNNMANSYRSLGKLKESLECHMKSLKIKEELNSDDETVAPSYWNIGNALGDVGKFEESNKYYNKAIKMYEKLGYEDDVMELKYLVMINMEQIDTTVNYIPETENFIQYYRERKYNNGLAGALDHAGGLYKKQGDLEKAEAYFKEALELAENNGEQSLPGLINRRLANLYKDQGLYEKALPFAEKALQSSEKYETRKKQIVDYKVLSEIHEKLGDPVKALNYYKLYHSQDKKILSKQNIDRINELEIEYESKEQQAEILLLTKEKEVSDTQKMLLGVGVLSLLVVVGALIFARIQRAKTTKLKQEQISKELDFKKQELLAYTTQLAHKNEVLEKLKSDLVEIKEGSNSGNELNSIVKSIDFNLKDDANWETFKARFESVHQGFTKKILANHPNLSSGDLRLVALLKMELNSKEIANLLNISPDGIKKARYRLRKKMNLESAESLENTILTI